MPLIDLPVPKRNPTPQELAQTVGESNEQLAYLLNGFLGSLNIRELTADKIKTGVLLANIVTIMSNLAGNGSITIDGSGMVINDGVKDVFKVDMNGKVTMTGATVQSSLFGPKVELNGIDNLFKASSDANNYISILPNQDGVPVVLFEGVGTGGILHLIAGKFIVSSEQGTEMIVNGSSGLFLRGNFVDVLSWSSFRNNSGRTLQQELDHLQNQINALQAPPPTGV